MIHEKPNRLSDFIINNGRSERYDKGKVFHAQSFSRRLFLLSSGYVKRYQVTTREKVIELIYGPGDIFPLSQLYKEIFGVEQNEQNFIYVYQAMTDIEIFSLSATAIVKELTKEPLLYIDLYYESGLRLKSNIELLASNSYKDNHLKIAHLLYSLAEGFGEPATIKGVRGIKIAVPLEPIDLAEQTNISENDVRAVLDSMIKRKLLHIDGNSILIQNIELLKDAFL